MLLIFGTILVTLVLVQIIVSEAQVYPVPIPKGGRTDVHGWLILPMEQPKSENATGIHAWFSHHVPEFWTDSPHNFQIILKGTLYPIPCVEGDLYPISIPLPPMDELVTFEYSFTPPSPFSLNDLLSGAIVNLRGVYYNGSFDTPYERIPMSLATLHIEELTTAVYLDEFQNSSYPNLQYLSYPRGGSGSKDFYFAHDIHAQPDFDHVVHGTVDQCSAHAQDALDKAGWILLFII